MVVDERDAIKRMKAGDIRGLETLVRAYQVRAVRAAYLITHDRPLAEDIVQTAFLRAYERIAQFDAERPFGPWFLRSVANDATKAISRRRSTMSLDSVADRDVEDAAGLDPPDPGPSPEALLLRAESDGELWDALGRLPLVQREAIVLRYHLELPEAEVAARLGVATGTAKSRLHHARKRLQKLLGGTRSHRTSTDQVVERLATADPANGTMEGGTER
jgi:RNA polymerase sigma-70 factor (ECF subfamily)